MLVLTRKADEALIIGDTVVVKVLSVRGNKVSLGIEAPKDVKVLRGELEVHEAPTD
jgi:carbon storage regulator